MRLRIAILLLIFLSAGAQAYSYLEDFEDDAPGGNPSESWYSYSENGDVSVISGIGVGGGNALRVQTSSITESIALFDTNSLIDGCDTANYGIEFDLKIASIGSDTNTLGRSFLAKSDTLTGNDEGFGTSHSGTSSDGQAFANGGSGGTFGETLSMSLDTWYHVEVIPDCQNNIASIYIDGGGPFTADATGSYGGILDIFRMSSGKMDVGTHSLYYDNLEFTAPAPPEPPTGVLGTVTDAVNSPETHRVTWNLSPDDTDQVNGDYTYYLYYDDGSENLAETVNPGSATDGVITAIVEVAITGEADWYVKANDGTFTSAASCIITLDSDIQDDTDSCGTTLPGEEQTGSTELGGENGILFGGDRNALAESLQISVQSLNFVIGLMLVLLIMAGGFFAYGVIGAAGWALVGVIVSWAVGLFPGWVLYFLGFILAAGGILYFKSRSN